MSRYRRQSSHLLSCFNPAAQLLPNLTTSLYRTDSGTFGLTWSRDHLFARSLHIHINHQSKPSFHLQTKPWNWTKRGSHTLPLPGAAVCWDLSRAKFGSGPAPTSAFYVAIIVRGNIVLLVGDGSPPVRDRKQHQQEPEKQAEE